MLTHTHIHIQTHKDIAPTQIHKYIYIYKNTLILTFINKSVYISRKHTCIHIQMNIFAHKTDVLTCMTWNCLLI